MSDSAILVLACSGATLVLGYLWGRGSMETKYLETTVRLMEVEEDNKFLVSAYARQFRKLSAVVGGKG